MDLIWELVNRNHACRNVSFIQDIKHANGQEMLVSYIPTSEFLKEMVKKGRVGFSISVVSNKMNYFSII